LHLACVCRAFSNDAWAHILRLLTRVKGSSEREREGRGQLRMLIGMPERVLHIRSIAFSLGVNANGLGLLGTLSLLSQTYPQLRGGSEGEVKSAVTGGAGLGGASGEEDVGSLPPPSPADYWDYIGSF